ncbi:MAG: IS5 family transposase [Cyanophyceae cyanobacterium]
MSQQGFWDFQSRQEKLAEQKDFLIELDRLIPWEDFRQTLELIHQKTRKSHAGRKPMDVILMFKLLMLQRLYNISDAELEYQVNDRLSFMRFLGLGLEDKVPDATTVWLFREQLTQSDLVRDLFQRFDEYLQTCGYQAQAGQIVDATLVPVPRQRNSREENAQIKAGKVPDSWQDNPKKLRQKDVDARWTSKNGQFHYGYKNHINVDVKYGFIRCYEVSDAAVHDSQILGGILDSENEDKGLWGDSAYRSEVREIVLSLLGFESHIHERGYRDNPLTEEQKVTNREKSKIRAKVEHNFGSWVNEMGGKTIKVIGKTRAKAVIGLRNLAYNLKRYVFWKKQELETE